MSFVSTIISKTQLSKKVPKKLKIYGIAKSKRGLHFVCVIPGKNVLKTLSSEVLRTTFPIELIEFYESKLELETASHIVLPSNDAE